MKKKKNNLTAFDVSHRFFVRKLKVHIRRKRLELLFTSDQFLVWFVEVVWHLDILVM